MTVALTKKNLFVMTDKFIVMNARKTRHQQTHYDKVQIESVRTTSRQTMYAHMLHASRIVDLTQRSRTIQHVQNEIALCAPTAFEEQPLPRTVGCSDTQHWSTQVHDGRAHPLTSTLPSSRPQQLPPWTRRDLHRVVCVALTASSALSRTAGWPSVSCYLAVIDLERA